jgi:hypothetical protein
MLRLHASERFDNTNFYLGKNPAVTNPSDKRIAQGIINSSMHSDLTHNILELPSSANVFEHLMLKFRMVNRAAQIQAWLDFVNIDPSKYNTLAGLYDAFNNTTKTFSKQGLTLNWDKMLGLIMQAHMQDGLRSALDQKVDLHMETHAYETPSST